MAVFTAQTDRRFILALGRPRAAHRACAGGVAQPLALRQEMADYRAEVSLRTSGKYAA